MGKRSIEQLFSSSVADPYKNCFSTHVKCCLRGCDKHCKLMGEQFILNSDDQGKFIQFVGRQSKTYQGGLRQVQQSNENIKHCYTSGKTFIPITFIKSLNIYYTPFPRRFGQSRLYYDVQELLNTERENYTLYISESSIKRPR